MEVLKDVLVIYGYVIKYLEIQQLETTNVCYLTNSYASRESGSSVAAWIWLRGCRRAAVRTSGRAADTQGPSGAAGPASAAVCSQGGWQEA